MLQSEHKNKLNFCLHKHHLLFVRLARICFLRYTPTDMLLADENRVAPRFRQSTSLKYAVRFSVHCWYLLPLQLRSLCGWKALRHKNDPTLLNRSEERRVGKECVSWMWR